MSNLKPAPLPVGDKPAWELRNAENDDEKLKSIPDSFVLLKSLKQSRDRWLQQTFPKFSTKPKGGKATDAPPIPPHTFQVRGRCDMHIGPHIFPETTIYEVTYVSSQPATMVAPTPGTATNPYWSSTVSYNAQYQQPMPTPQSTTAPVASTSTAPAPASAPAVTPSASASASSSTTPAPATAGVATTSAQPTAHVGLDLIGKVNQAAANDPILSALLKTAAGGKATPEELKRLGLFIQSLDHITFPGPAVPAATAGTPTPQTPSLTHGATPPAPPASAPPKVDYYQRYPPQVAVAPAVSIKPFDVVLEFRESPGDRWLFPRGSVFWDTIPPNTNDPRTNPDITLTTCLSNDGRISECLAEAPADAGASDETRARYPVTITLKEAPLTLSDTIYRWIGGAEANASNKEQIEKIKSFKRLFLGLQIPPGTLLTQLQAACNPAYALKPLRQGPAPPPRAPRPRKPPTEPKKVAKPPPEQREPPAPPLPPPAKRPRPMPSKPVAPPPIRCSSCGQTDVPLIMGGKYCKPCVEAQRHLTSMAPTPLSMSSWATPQPFVFTAPVLARPASAVESASASPPAPSNS